MTTEIRRTALRTTGHCVDMDSSTFYMTPTYEKKSCVYGTVEYKRRREVLKELPQLTIKVYSIGHTSKNLLTYKHMESYIAMMPDMERHMAEFARVKLKSHSVRGGYKYVADWFSKEFPHYETYLIKDKDGKITWSITNEVRKAMAEEQHKTESDGKNEVLPVEEHHEAAYV